MVTLTMLRPQWWLSTWRLMTAERDKKRSYLVFRLVAAVCSVAFVVWTLLISTREVVVDGSSGVVKSSKNTDLELATLTSHFVIKPASNDILEAELGARRLNYDLFDIPWNDLIIPCFSISRGRKRILHRCWIQRGPSAYVYRFELWIYNCHNGLRRFRKKYRRKNIPWYVRCLSVLLSISKFL